MNRLKTFFLLLFLFSFIFPPIVAGQTLEIPGTGDSQLLLRAMAASFNAVQSEIHAVIPDSIGSGGGIKSVATGKNELARVARNIKKKEQRYGLEYLQFASSPVVFAVSRNITGLENITADQIVGIYSGRITDWSDFGSVAGKIYCINREPGDSSRDIVGKYVPGFKGIEKMAGLVVFSTPETADFLFRKENTIAYLPLSMTIGKKVNILNFDGFAVHAVGYPLTIPFGFVWKGQLSGGGTRFMDFVFSEQGHKIITDFGAIPLAR